jgi:hypothetical protein
LALLWLILFVSSYLEGQSSSDSASVSRAIDKGLEKMESESKKQGNNYSDDIGQVLPVCGTAPTKQRPTAETIEGKGASDA